MTDTILIFDTTLRDGEQSPGCSMNLEEKLKVAAQLETMGVDIIEAGFAIASEGDFEAVSAVARQAERAIVASLARAATADIDRAWEAVKHARRPRIHTFIATSPLHMRVKLNKTPDEVLAQIERTVGHARNLCPDVEWSAEDATRSEPDFLARCIETAIRCGARTINLPDTVGYATPETYGAMFADMIARVPNADRAVFSTHCHNDRGCGSRGNGRPRCARAGDFGSLQARGMLGRADLFRAARGAVARRVIETERLLLRPWHQDDAAEFLRVTNTPAVMAHLGGVQQEPSAIHATIARQTRYQAEHGHSMWIVERQEDHVLLGFCGLQPGSVGPLFGEIEIGWRLREDAWGQGYAKEAALASLSWGWANLGVPRIMAITVPANTASWGLMERLGMVRRADLDFGHPSFEPGHPLHRHIVYVAERPR